MRVCGHVFVCVGDDLFYLASTESTVFSYSETHILAERHIYSEKHNSVFLRTNAHLGRTAYLLRKAQQSFPIQKRTSRQKGPAPSCSKGPLSNCPRVERCGASLTEAVLVSLCMVCILIGTPHCLCLLPRRQIAILSKALLHTGTWVGLRVCAESCRALHAISTGFSSV